MTHSPRTLVGALVLTFIACSTFVACGTAVVPEEPELTTGRRLSGLCGDAWNATGSMAQGRFIATATRLADGTVVVAGGYWDDGTGNSGLANGVERYDPANETWSAAGPLNVPRYWHRAVALQNGKVLLVGGQTESGPTATAEIYNPATNAWSLAAPMSTARWGHQLTVLKDGRVLAFGGFGPAGVLATAEVYDPVRNTWISVGSMATSRLLAASVLLNDGKVLVAGGYNGGGTGSTSDYESSAEIFNPSSGVWSAAASMSVTRYASSMSLLPDGRALVAGGTDQYPGAEIFNPVSNTWTPTNDMVHVPRYFFETIPLADGRVMVAGGASGTGYLDGVEIFDAALGQWTQINSMSASRSLAASTELRDGRILIAGGFTITGTGNGVTTNAAETYLPCLANLPPVAVCANRIVSAGPTCTGTAVSVNNGSYDPDNGPGPLMLAESPSAPFALGNTTVTLTASDGQSQGTCLATVTVKDDTPPQVTCQDDDPNVPGNQAYLECVNGGAAGTFTAQVTDNCGGTTTAACTSSGAQLPLGEPTNVTCTASDGSQNQASCHLQAIVRDTQPPVPGPSKDMVLSAVNGALQEVTLMDCADFTVDACYGRLNPLKDYGFITYITSDEPENAPGSSDGNTTGDIQIKKPWLALLRAERDSNGDGRVYTLHYLVKDPSGNVAPGSCKVGVPITPGSPAVDNGPGYCVTNPYMPGNACP